MARSDRRDRTDSVVLLVVWVLPLLAASGLIAAAGLPLLAVALIVVEVAVAGGIVLARRRPARSQPKPAAPAWLVPAVMVLALAATAGVALVVSALG